MKKIYFSLLFLACYGFMQAQAMVTFQVDMSGETVSELGVHVAGSFQGWSPGTTQLTDPDGDGIYSVTVNVTPGDYQYKYINGNNWGPNECNNSTDCAACGSDDGNGGFNRSFTVAASDTEITLPAYVYNSCTITEVSSTSNLLVDLGVKIAPNPMTDKAVITFSNAHSEKFDVTISTLTGKVIVARKGVRDSTLDLSRGDLASGIYFITFRNEAGKVGTQKLVVQ